MNKKQKQHQSVIPGVGVAVVGKDIGYALRQFKRQVKSAGILNEVKSRQEYIKPSVQRRQQKIKASYIQRMKSFNEKDM